MEKISNHSDIYSCLDASKITRGPSAARFCCQVGVTIDGNSDDNKLLEGEYYKVTSRINGLIDLVYISSEGIITLCCMAS